MSTDYESYLVQLREPDADGYEGLANDRSLVERLLDQLEAHEASERELLDDYRRAAEAAPDRGVRFLMGLVLEDEERHHRLMAAMARDVRSSVQWQTDGLPLPPISATTDNKPRLLAQTLRFLEVEEENERQLKQLRRDIKRARAGLMELIVGSMEADTRKHIGILKYIRKQLSA